MAGKNPVTHVGKLYTTAANRIASAICSEVPAVGGAECYLVSRIGAQIDQPQIAHISVRTSEIQLPPESRAAVTDVAVREISKIRHLWRDFLEGAVPVA